MRAHFCEVPEAGTARRRNPYYTHTHTHTHISVLTPEAFAQTARLFPGHVQDDVSGMANEVDDTSAEKPADFSSSHK